MRSIDFSRADLAGAEERFWAKTEPEPNSGCLLWTANVSRMGYGRIQIGSKKNGTRRMVSAHRVAWTLMRGDIPGGLFVCHRCDVKTCVNVNHLFTGTHIDNMRDASRKGRIPGRLIGPECSRGHEYTPENTKFVTHSKRGGNAYRDCRICSKQHNADAYARKKQRKASAESIANIGTD
jgi:hypothetical protein